MSKTGVYTDTGNSKSNLVEYSVSEISSALKRTVEERFGSVRIRGEISGFRGQHSSGHCYFSLKDERARIEAVIWRGAYNKLSNKPEEGFEVIASGKLTTYPGSSKYQIVIDNLEPAGAGALMALLEARKKKLEAEGLFAQERKQLLPFLPGKIGVVTSPTGAVIHDILQRLKNRYSLHVLVWPVRVQGESTGMEVSNAILGFNALSAEMRPDLIIVARGGGSIEDLWGFNDEAVVRAVSQSDIPLISAVGHETDWTLIDLVADLRAPTPTGAAELAVPVKAELDAALASFKARIQSAQSRIFDWFRSNLRASIRGLSTSDALLELPRRKLDEASGRLGIGLELATRSKRVIYEKTTTRLSSRGLGHLIASHRQKVEGLGLLVTRAFDGVTQRKAGALANAGARLSFRPFIDRISAAGERMSGLSRQINTAMRNHFHRMSSRLAQDERMFASLSYKSVLARGYAVIRSPGNKPIASITKLTAETAFQVEMKDGSLNAIIPGSKNPDALKVKSKKTDTQQSTSNKQGYLF